jgi:hypothetical protein
MQRRMSIPIRLAVALAAATALIGCRAALTTPGSTKLPRFGPGNKYHPTINPADFSPNVTNPWFPLTPGTTLIFTGSKEGKVLRNLVKTTSNTKVVDGATVRVVHDELYLDGKLAERTDDYYAQDKAGNVWYFGEDTAELDDNGQVASTEGSFLAGIDGAQPGVFMEANPKVGHEFRQEYYKGHAEDQFKVLDLSASVTVPYRTFNKSLRTKETTALEPGIVDNKYYVKGIGEVEEIQVSGEGPGEKAVLTEIKTA